MILKCLIALFVLVLLSSQPAAAQQAATGPAVLYFFAHQDDEIDVAAKIVTDLRRGRAVYAAWLTNGGRGGDPVVREKESRAVMDMLGVPDRNLFFLGYPDQEAYKYLEAALADVEKLVQRLSPIEFTAHAYEGGNIDHDAVAFIAALAARRFDVPLFEFPDSNMYQGRARVWTFLPRDDTPTLYTRLDKKLYGLRMRVQHSYPNQAASLSFYDFAMDKKSFIKNGEPYRAAPAYDFTKPPAPEVRYSITSQGLVTVDMWIEAARAFL